MAMPTPAMAVDLAAKTTTTAATIKAPTMLDCLLIFDLLFSARTHSLFGVAFSLAFATLASCHKSLYIFKWFLDFLFAFFSPVCHKHFSDSCISSISSQFLSHSSVFMCFSLPVSLLAGVLVFSYSFMHFCVEQLMRMLLGY